MTATVGPSGERCDSVTESTLEAADDASRRVAPQRLEAVYTEGARHLGTFGNAGQSAVSSMTSATVK